MEFLAGFVVGLIIGTLFGAYLFYKSEVDRCKDGRAFEGYDGKIYKCVRVSTD